MLGPIPNSLGAGAYNGSFFPHGLVTFSTRGLVVVVRQEICLEGVRHSVFTLTAVSNTTAVLEAVQRVIVPLGATQVTTQALEASRVTVQSLEGLIEECD